MIIGFTGTQEGMSERQLGKLLLLLVDNGAKEFHHGDCVGADDQADLIARGVGCEIVIHPPDNNRKRAFCHRRGPARLLKPKPYLIRNHDIVNACELLLAAPRTMVEEAMYSGTWATIRFAKQMRRRGLILAR